MAKAARRTKAANKDQFTPGAKPEGVENATKLAASASVANAAKGIGHNSGGITDDEMSRQMERIDAAKEDMDAAQVKLDKTKGVYRQAIGVAKSKGFPVDDLKEVFKIEKQAEGTTVTSHRNIRRILQLRGSPLVEQFDLFNVPGTEPVEEGGRPAKPGMDAELQGQAAWRNKEPRSNNQYQPGTEDYAGWDQGWLNAEAAATGQIGRGTPEAAANA